MHQKKFSILLVALIAISLFAWVQPAYATVTWTYNAGTNTATASGAGSTNFAALVAADTAGGWGVYTVDATGKQNKATGKIILGDGTNTITWTDTIIQILFYFTSWTGGGIIIEVKNHATLTLGAVFDSTKKSTGNGCEIIFSTDQWANCIQVDSGGTLNLYSCHIIGSPNYDSYIYEPSGGTTNVWNCVYDRISPREPRGTYYNNIMWAKIGINSPQSTLTFSKNTLTRATQWLGWFYNSVTISELKSLYSGVIRTEGTVTLNFVNCELDNWAFSWTGSSVLNRQYTFDLTVLNGDITDIVENANVTLTKNGALIFTELTDSEGAISQKTVTYGFYNSTGGNTLYDGEYPFILTITHPDWANYTSRFYVTEKTNLIVSMQEITPDATQTVTNNFGAFILIGIIGFILILILIKRRYA